MNSTFTENEIGFELRTERVLLFFGNRNSELEQIKQRYSEISFKAVHQIHGNTFVESSAFYDESRQADAHWSREKGLGLLVKTADCIPLVAYKSDFSKVVAVHAGWRGVQKQIIPMFFKNDRSDWNVFIGPHITQHSFQIQEDCLNLLKECTELPVSDWYSNGKADLLKIVLNQLQTCGIMLGQVSLLKLDTFQDLRFHSFRRDKEKAGRQLSFVSLLK